MRRAHGLVLAPVALLAALGISSCGSSPHPAATTSGAGSQCGTGSSAIALIPSADRSPAGVWGTAPKVVVPKGSPPSALECVQLIAGKGAKAKSGDTLEMQYVLASYSSRGVVQSSWTSSPFTFTLGVTPLIPGWVTGVTGMQAGARRELIIPPSLGYGAESPGAGIAPNDTLVFVLDLLKIT